MLELREFLKAMEENEDIIIVAKDDDNNTSLGNHTKESWLLALDYMGNTKFTITQIGKKYGYTCLRLGEIRCNQVKRLEVLSNDAACTIAFSSYLSVKEEQTC